MLEKVNSAHLMHYAISEQQNAVYYYFLYPHPPAAAAAAGQRLRCAVAAQNGKMADISSLRFRGAVGAL